MAGIQDVLQVAMDRGLVRGSLRGLLHVCIGRQIAAADGSVVSPGATWRELADALQALRYDVDLVRELGLDPVTLSPRDRRKFWYAAIALAKVDSPAAYAEAEKWADALEPFGFTVGPPPAVSTSPKPPRTLPTPVAEPAADAPAKPHKKPGKRKK